MLLTIVSASVGIAELHCACVARDQDGLLLAGPSGSGKSTLSLALSQIGFGFLSDDRTFCSLDDGEVVGWGLPTRLKLRPEAALWFQELWNQQPTHTHTGEPAFWLDPEDLLGLKRVRRCRPSALIFLERQVTPKFCLSRIPSIEALHRLNKDLMPELPDAAAKRSSTIARLVEYPCWLLQYGGEPRAVARNIVQHLARPDCSDNQKPGRTRCAKGDFSMQHVGEMPSAEMVPTGRDFSDWSGLHAEPHYEDPLRRFTPTPYIAALPVMGRTVRLETNNPKISKHAVELFAGYPRASKGDPDFLWRIVVEPDVQLGPRWPRRSAFSDNGLRFVEFGQRNFLAVDLEAREAIGILSASLIEDELGLTSPFLDNLFCLTSGGLGLVPVWANCVARDDRGVLLFGEPNSGKTSASYVAEKLGLDFHADEGAFIELDSGALRSWGGFWPATFRPEMLQFFPELKERSRPCFHRDFVVQHFAKQDAHGRERSSIQPLCCLFLERQSSSLPSFSRIARQDLARLLAKSVLFKDDERFRQRQATVLHALEELPAYLLRYGSDPGIAAATARDLLAAQDYTDPGQELVARQSTRQRLESVRAT